MKIYHRDIPAGAQTAFECKVSIIVQAVEPEEKHGYLHSRAFSFLTAM